MHDTPGNSTEIEIVDVRQVTEWRHPPKVSFDKMASLKIAERVIWLFAGVYLACFVLSLCSFSLAGATYDKGSELVKFLLQSILPIVTLAVGYYLGDRSRQQQATA